MSQHGIHWSDARLRFMDSTCRPFWSCVLQALVLLAPAESDATAEPLNAMDAGPYGASVQAAAGKQLATPVLHRPNQHLHQPLHLR